ANPFFQLRNGCLRKSHHQYLFNGKFLFKQHSQYKNGDRISLTRPCAGFNQITSVERDIRSIKLFTNFFHRYSLKARKASEMTRVELRIYSSKTPSLSKKPFWNSFERYRSLQGDAGFVKKSSIIFLNFTLSNLASRIGSCSNPG